MPKADYDLIKGQLDALQTQALNRAEADITAAVEAAIEGGKVAPASKDYHIAACRAEGGLDRFKKMVGAAAPIGAPSGLDGKEAPGATGGGLTPEELAVCNAVGKSPEDFMAAKAAESKG